MYFLLVLECLFGKRRNGLTGAITYVGVSHSRTAFIGQHDDLLDKLTVRETLLFASRIKNTFALEFVPSGLATNDLNKRGSTTTSIKPMRKSKLNSRIFHLEKVNDIIKQLWLSSCADVRVGKCSGGQRKRVSIACELISQPSLLILDEPTSGLDSATCLQCVQLLRNLIDTSNERLSILISVHQPSARILSQFDHIFVLTKDGQSLYTGAPANLVSFLSEVNLVCPKFHNPGDFVIEVASGDLGADILQRIQNAQPITVSESLVTNMTKSIETRTKSRFSSHFFILLCRNMAVVTREPLLMSLRLFSHVSVGIVVSLLYGENVGEAPGCRTVDSFQIANQLDERLLTKTNENTTLILFTLMFLSFTAMMPTVLTFPRELAVFRKEHQNNWYSSIAYYLARTLIDLPFHFVFPAIYALIVYPMTGQPESESRLALFIAVCCLVSLVAQSIGVLIGTIFSESLNIIVFLSPISTIPAFLFSGFFVRLDSMPTYMRPFAYTSYVKYAFECFVIVIYGFNRCRDPRSSTTSTRYYHENQRDQIDIGATAFNSSDFHNELPINQPNTSEVFKLEQYYGYRPVPFSYVIKEFDLEHQPLWEGCVCLLAIFMILRILSFLCLKRQINAKG